MSPRGGSKHPLRPAEALVGHAEPAPAGPVRHKRQWHYPGGDPGYLSPACHVGRRLEPAELAESSSRWAHVTCLACIALRAYPPSKRRQYSPGAP